ncbi:MAG: preprotein translocase subunit SecE [Gammaproteobacteria bacterium]|nr:preprotein translocase subunit SecE [Gammaproteobacteria bacterium]
MSTKIEVQESRGDTLKLGAAVVLMLAGIYGFYHFADESLLYRVLGLLAVAVVALAIAYQSTVGRRAWSFVQDSRTEVRKVVWPTRNETMQTTLIVILLVLLVCLILWALDGFFGWGFRMLTGTGS